MIVSGSPLDRNGVQQGGAPVSGVTKLEDVLSRLRRGGPVLAQRDVNEATLHRRWRKEQLASHALRFLLKYTI